MRHTPGCASPARPPHASGGYTGARPWAGIAAVIRVAAIVTAVVTAALATPASAADTAAEDPFGDEPWPPAAGGAEATAQTGDVFGASPVELYGSITTVGETQLGEAGDPIRGEDLAIGTATSARLKADWEPDERVLAHLELVGQHRSGVLNPYTYAQAAGIDASATTALMASNPQDDFADTLYLDQAWAQLRFERFDLQVGKQPIAWGTGYAFNPTARTHLSAGLAGFEDDETPGTAAISAGVPLLGSLVTEGYVAFEERTHASFTTSREVDPAFLPWGARLRMPVGSFDVAVGAISEVVAGAASGARLERYLHVAGETVGSIGDVGVYGEAAWTMPVWDAPQAGAAPADWNGLQALDSTVGLEYVLPADVEVKIEFYRRGRGATSPDAYDPAALLSGLTSVLARDYLFGYLGKTFLSYLDVSLAALTNLNDGSVLVYQQNEYAVSDNLTVSLAGVVPTGTKDAELGGTRTIAGRDVRFVRPAVIARLEISF